MQFSHRLFNFSVTGFKLCALFCIAMVTGFASRAQLPTIFYNNGYYSYPPASPNFVATNFYNDYGGTFSMNTAVVDDGWSINLYNGWQSTLNFTNHGEMDSDFGFFFNEHNGGTHLADNVFNDGTINCGIGSSAVLSLLGSFTVGGGTTVNLFGFGGFFFYATNVINNGTFNVGSNGLGRVWAQNVDLTRGTFAMNGGATFTGVGQAAINTNIWLPGSELTQNSAISAPIGLLGNFPLFLSPSVSYFSVVPDSTGTNVTVRMVFIQDYSPPNVTNNIYFGGAAFGSGFTTVGWTGTYIDYATGQMYTNYLYLNDDYVQGSTTNIFGYGAGVPPNFAFTESTTPLNLGAPATSSFSPLGNAFVSNNVYTYFNASFIDTSMPLSAIPNGALTNIVGRFEVQATNELNLSLTTMSGMNYLLLKSTNNFDYDGQSFIAAPFADLYLGRTNNSMAITNLVQPQIPVWSGNVQAWNTRWFYTNAGINYDYRVLLVLSSNNPVAPTEQQDVMLYSTNSVTISDTLNIFRNFYLNCTNLVTTTNGFGTGAASPDGELNLLNTTNMYWQNCTPYLRNLTNGGAIRTFNLAVFGTPAVPYFTFYNSGVISNGAGCSICAGDFENYGAISSGTGTFAVEALNSTMTNSSVMTGGAFTNVSSTLIVSNVSLLIGKGATFIVTNLFTDEGATNNFWSLGSGNYGSGIASGLMMLGQKPVYGDLLLTTITNIATSNTLVNLTWAGNDLGYSNLGYSNNVAIGQMIFNAQAPAPRTAYAFSATGLSNAMYVDQIILLNGATNLDSHGNVSAFSSFNNLNIYYGDVLVNGVSVAEKLDHKNSNHLHWVATYAGIFSGTNIVYPPGVTNRVNFALANSPDLDSNGNGIPNVSDPNPIFDPAQLDFTQTLTNLPPRSIRLQWHSIPASTNYVVYTTNLTGGNWFVLTNFISPTNVPPVTGWPLTNTVYDVISPNFQKFYQVHVDPNSVDLYGQ